MRSSALSLVSLLANDDEHDGFAKFIKEIYEGPSVDEECLVCMDSVPLGQRLRVPLGCSGAHWLCRPCRVKVIMAEAACPVCATPIKVYSKAF